VLVNNAGYRQIAPFEQMSAEDFQAIVDTCFYGVVYTTRAAARRYSDQLGAARRAQCAGSAAGD
jgi:NAD(P)-dependent dehydrogenase (short-subunit alcohol dehydrogenase family)